MMNILIVSAPNDDPWAPACGMQAVTEALAARLSAEQEEVREVPARRSMHRAEALCRRLLDRILGEQPQILRPRFDPAKFDLVLVCATLVGGKPPAALQSYLSAMARRLPVLALVVGGGKSSRGLAELARLAQRLPRVEAVLHGDMLENGQINEFARVFVDSLPALATQAPLRPKHDAEARFAAAKAA